MHYPLCYGEMFPAAGEAPAGEDGCRRGTRTARSSGYEPDEIATSLSYMVADPGVEPDSEGL